MLFKSRFFPILMGLIMLSPMGIDIYISSLPDIIASLHVTDKQAQLTINIYLFFLGVAQILVGPLTDHYGRRPIALIGIMIYAAAAWFISFSDNFILILIARGLQGASACCATTVAFSAAKDLCNKDQVTTAMSYLSAAFTIIPTVAPALGGIIATHYGWQSDFIFMSLFASFIFVWLYKGLPESCPSIGQHKKIYSWARYQPVLQHKPFLFYVISATLALTSIIAYITFLPLWMMDEMHLSQGMFIFIFSFNAFLNVLANFSTPQLLKRFTNKQLIFSGLTIQIFAGLALVFNHYIIPNSLLGFMIPAACFCTSLAWVLAPFTSAALIPFDQNAGTASALFSFIQLCGASSIVALLQLVKVHPVYLCGAVILLPSFTILCCFKQKALNHWHSPQQPA